MKHGPRHNRSRDVTLVLLAVVAVSKQWGGGGGWGMMVNLFLVAQHVCNYVALLTHHLTGSQLRFQFRALLTLSLSLSLFPLPFTQHSLRFHTPAPKSSFAFLWHKN